MKQIHADYWEHRYPDNYHLELLVTHPDYRRRGAGTLLTQWGIDQSLREGCDVGVEGSVMGAPLYKHLGFELQEVRKIQLEGDDVFLESRIMAIHHKA
jgi:GNAT superfamily N-acetyltransferase